jgi:hypothetical protein
VNEIRCGTPPKHQVWVKIKAISGKNYRKMIRTLKISEGNLKTNWKEKSQLLADQFKTTSHDSNYSADFIKRKRRGELQTISPELDQGLPFSEAEMEYALSTCKGFLPGPDDLHYEMLKHMMCGLYDVSNTYHTPSLGRERTHT